jgi:hypothetical protein
VTSIRCWTIACRAERVPPVRHGTHALGGEHHDKIALGLWLGRLARLGTSLRLTVTDVWGKGLPHNTTVIVRWTATNDLPDGMRARLLFNAISHQYLIPGVQVGAKVQVDKATGEVVDVFSVVRPVTSESGCLLCNRLINSARLQEESISEGERKGQRYVEEPEVIAPSVITLNAVAASHAADDFLFYMTGLRDSNVPTAYMRFQPRSRQVWLDEPRKSPGCPECGVEPKSRLARGDARRLPVIDRKSSK